MELFRICKEKYSFSFYPSGLARRWNQAGQNVIYVGSSRSLSTLELLVNSRAISPEDVYKIMVISVSDDDHLVRQIRTGELPDNWRTLSGYPNCQSLGSSWYEGQESLLLKVPSAVIPQEHNFIIHTEHPDFGPKVELVRTEDYFWDSRLFPS